MNALTQFFQELNHDAAAGTPAWVVARLLAAALLGAAVAGLYLHARDPNDRTRGFPQTLILLAPLITMVTMAVGTNVAAAFTLVGTLAIVRFRTVVRETRDTVYVIFAVAVGMALGTPNLLVAASGVLVVGVVSMVVRAAEHRNAARRATLAELRIVISPPDHDPGVYAVVAERFHAVTEVRRASIDRSSNELDVRLAITGVDRNDGPALVAALLEAPEVVRASFSLEPDSP
jgi:hypothetical protein